MRREYNFLPPEILVIMRSQISDYPTLAPKIVPRPLHSKSPAFEAGYAAFLDDIFENDIRSVVSAETKAAKSIILAGCIKISASKKTGLIRMERRINVKDEKAIWKPCKLWSLKFWERNDSLIRHVSDAWKFRLTQIVPPASECYPVETWGEPESDLQWMLYLDIACKRRMGGKNNTSAALKTFTGLLWKFLVDADLLRLCHIYFGHHATLSDYNFTVLRSADLKARELETPNLARLIGEYVKIDPDLKSGRKALPQDVLMKSKKWHFQGDISPAGWRYLARLPRSFMDTIVRCTSTPGYPGHIYEGALINLLAACGEQAPLSFLQWTFNSFLNWNSKFFNENHAHVLHFMRLANKEAILRKKRKKLKSFVQGDLVLAWDWFAPFPDYPGDVITAQKIPKNFTWAAIMRAQLVWHEQAAERERIRREQDALEHARFLAAQAATTWDSAIAEMTIDGAKANPLTTGKLLLEEGRNMSHCVGDYIDSCKEDRSRIFHLDLDGEAATLEIARHTKTRWEVRQLFGHQNDPSSKQLWKIAKKIANLYSAASRSS